MFQVFSTNVSYLILTLQTGNSIYGVRTGEPWEERGQLWLSVWVHLGKPRQQEGLVHLVFPNFGGSVSH